MGLSDSRIVLILLIGCVTILASTVYRHSDPPPNWAFHEGTEWLVIGPDGAAGVTGPVQYQKQWIRRACNNARIGEYGLNASGDPRDTFGIYHPNWTVWPVFEIDVEYNGTYAHSVFTTNPSVIGPDGIRNANTLLGDLTARQRQDCVPGQGPLAERIICLEEGADGGPFRLLFAKNPAFEEARANGDPDAHLKMVLEEMRYYLHQSVQ